MCPFHNYFMTLKVEVGHGDILNAFSMHILLHSVGLDDYDGICFLANYIMNYNS